MVCKVANVSGEGKLINPMPRLRQFENFRRIAFGGLSQREAGAEAGCSQATAKRDYHRVKYWISRASPEEYSRFESEMTGEPGLRFAQRMHREILNRQLGRINDEFEEAKAAVGDKKQPRARVGLFREERAASANLVLLAAGFVQCGKEKIPVAKDMDWEQKQRVWDDMVRCQTENKTLHADLTKANAQIDTLKQRLAALSGTGKRADAHSAGLAHEGARRLDSQCPTAPGDSTPLGAGLPTSPGGDLRSGVAAGSETRAEQGGVSATQADPEAGLPPAAKCDSLSPNDSEQKQKLQAIEDRTRASLLKTYGSVRDYAWIEKNERENPTHSVGWSPLVTERAGEPPPKFVNPLVPPGPYSPFHPDLKLMGPAVLTRQEIIEGLEAICRVHNATGRGRPIRPEQITSLPAPRLMTPAQYIERGYPYMVYVEPPRR